MFAWALKIKRFSTVIMITLLVLVSLSLPSPARASGTPVFDASVYWTTWKGFADTAANWLTNHGEYLANQALIYAENSLLRELTKATVKWIDSGFDGSPAFITDTGAFLQDTADRTIGDFLMNDPALNFLCDPFKIQLKINLGLQYAPFEDEIKCSFTNALGNVDTALMDTFTGGDFINGGGWDSWLQITTVPQNNPLGAMVIAQEELTARIAGNKEITLAEANWGQGFLTFKKCTGPDGKTATSYGALDAKKTNTVDRSGNVTFTSSGDSNTTCVAQTPGEVISNAINWADSSDIRKTELANDTTDILNALLNQLTSKLTNGLLSQMGGTSQTYNSYDTYTAYLNSLASSTASTSNATVNNTSPSSPANPTPTISSVTTDADGNIITVWSDGYTTTYYQATGIMLDANGQEVTVGR